MIFTCSTVDENSPSLPQPAKVEDSEVGSEVSHSEGRSHLKAHVRRNHQHTVMINVNLLCTCSTFGAVNSYMVPNLRVIIYMTNSKTKLFLFTGNMQKILTFYTN